MIASLTIVRYKKRFIPLALMAMALHRLPMSRQKGCTFWKLIGSGRDEGFNMRPDWQQWGIFAVWDSEEDFYKFNSSSFISKWWSAFTYEQWTILLQPLQSRGKWSGVDPFEGLVPEKMLPAPIAILTQARIRLGKLQAFWSSVKGVQDELVVAPGRIRSIGIGETPYIASTFSIWDNAENMKAFAYRPGKHADVIKRAREENWLSEELFVRFRPIASLGTLNGTDPLTDIT